MCECCALTAVMRQVHLLESPERGRGRSAASGTAVLVLLRKHEELVLGWWGSLLRSRHHLAGDFAACSVARCDVGMSREICPVPRLDAGASC